MKQKIYLELQNQRINVSMIEFTYRNIIFY